MPLRDYIFGKKPNKYLDNQGRPKTIITTGASKGISGLGQSQRNEAMLKKYWNYYESEGTIFASINTTAWNSVMVGYYLISEHEDAKEYIQQKLELMDLDSVLLDNVIYGLIYGDSFIEKVKDSSGKLIQLKSVDPTTMQINTNEYGNVINYQQKISGKLYPPIEATDIIHLRFFPKPDSPYGVSIIAPSKDTIDRKITTDESIANAVKRHGTPKYVVSIGTEEEIPPKEVFTDIKSKLEDISSLNEFIVPGLVKINTIDESGIQSVKEYYDYFQTQLIVGLLCPEEALGQGKGSTEATSRVKEIMYERFIKAIQHKLTTLVRLNIINTILTEINWPENIVYMRFNSVTDADEAVKAKWLGNLLRGYPDIEKPFTVDEVRAIFDYPPMKKDIQQQPTQQPQQPQQPKLIQPQEQDVEEDVETIKEELDVIRTSKP